MGRTSGLVPRTPNNAQMKQVRQRDPLHMECAVRAALDVLKGRWKPRLLFELKERPKRFSQLQTAIKGASAQALTAQLRELASDGVIARTVHADSPVRVEYSLTDFGRALSGAMDQLNDWGEAYLDRHRAGKADHG